VKVRYTPRGRALAKKEITWWRENRKECPERVYDELQEVIRRIPKLGKSMKPHARLDGELVWRLLTRSTRLQVYYTIDDEKALAHIEYVWGARRGKGPPLDDDE
jgi:hypothetical protein